MRLSALPTSAIVPLYMRVCWLTPLVLRVVLVLLAVLVLVLADMGGETIFLALSGITGPASVTPYRAGGVHGVLVGEALMKADDAAVAIEALRTAPASM